LLDARGGEADGSAIDGADLDGSDLDGSDLDGSDMDGSDVDGSDLDGSDMDDMALAEIDDGLVLDTFLRLVLPKSKKNRASGCSHTIGGCAWAEDIG
jgi:hypothetical protein